MNYTARPLSLTPCQWNIAYAGAYNSQADHIEVDCDHNVQDITINAGPPVIWDYTRVVNGSVIVKPGARLIITCDLFIKNHIIVERGAYLEVNGATIRNLCPEIEWKGIRVWGNANVAHSSVNINNLQTIDPGVVNLVNATLHYAGNPAVYTNRGGGWFPDHWGGIVLADNTTFSDCRKAAAFMKYEYDNMSRFNQCTFTSDRGFGGVTMWATKGITFENCDFLDLGSMDDFGILSGDASANIINENEFVDLMYGIYADATMPLPVEYKVGGQGQRNFFHELDYGIFSNGILGLDVDKNDFFNVEYGANLEGDSEFSFTFNSFDDFTNRGIKLYITGDFDNDIWYNTFNSLGPVRGVDAFSTNSNLEYILNCFDTNSDIYHYAVSSYVRHQGSSGNLPLNFFTNTSTPQYYILSSTNLPRYWTLNPIIYPTVNPRLIPNCDVLSQCAATSDHMNRFGSLIIGDPVSFCGPVILGGGGNQDSEEYLSLFEENDISWTGFYDQQSILEGLDYLANLGTSTSLLESIESEQNVEVIMSELNAATPYLSDMIMEGVLKNQILSDSQKVLTLKKHVPLSMEMISLAQNELSQDHYSLLLSYNGMRQYSSRDSLLAIRDEADGDLQIIFYELLSDFWTSGEFQNVDLLLDEHEIPISKRLRISSALVQENFSLAQNLINNYPETSLEDLQFKDIQGVNLKRLQNHGLYTPNSDELQLLNEYASSNTASAVYARALLRYFEGMLFVHRDYDELEALNRDLGPEGRSQEFSTKENMIMEAAINIVPNPSSGNFVVNSTNMKLIRKVSIMDVNGSIVYLRECRSESVFVELANKPVNGIYYVVSEFIDGTLGFTSILINE